MDTTTVEYHTEPGHLISTPPTACALCKRDREALALSPMARRVSANKADGRRTGGERPMGSDDSR